MQLCLAPFKPNNGLRTVSPLSPFPTVAYTQCPQSPLTIYWVLGTVGIRGTSGLIPHCLVYPKFHMS